MEHYPFDHRFEHQYMDEHMYRCDFTSKNQLHLEINSITAHDIYRGNLMDYGDGGVTGGWHSIVASHIKVVCGAYGKAPYSTRGNSSFQSNTPTFLLHPKIINTILILIYLSALGTGDILRFGGQRSIPARRAFEGELLQGSSLQKYIFHEHAGSELPQGARPLQSGIQSF